MALTPAQIAVAQGVQHAASHDPLQQVRVVAGPGTGKSSAIEEHVLWLLNQGVAAQTIYAVSFTRASALDLRQRVHGYCTTNGHPEVSGVRISTLHSLALRTLRSAGLLGNYPVEPLVLDNWESENIFDAEFGERTGKGKQRCEAIRAEHDAFWNTGQWGPPNYIPPDPPISASERTAFNTFHSPRTQAYSCVLPGETVRNCVVQLHAGTFNPIQLLGLQHLIVDEYQDLNPMDLDFIDALANQGAHLFVAGDDDQSIYSFRYASPAGLQQFVNKYPQCGQHTLNACFRSTPTVLAAADALIVANPPPNRIPKNQQSLYATSVPPVPGVCQRWVFPSGNAEAQALAESCRDLITAGLNPRDILVLVSNTRAQLSILSSALQAAGVPFETPRTETILDAKIGRFALSLMRILKNPNDYVAHRVLLGLLPGVGIKTCAGIADAVITGNLNYRSIFYQQIPNGVFNTRQTTAINRARAICAQIQTWQATDTFAIRANDLLTILTNAFEPADIQLWQTYIGSIPNGIMLEELRDYLWADTDEQQSTLLTAVMTRLGLQIPATGVLPPRIRVMTMHGAKGLSGKVVFIPGLEEETLPGPWRRPYPGLVLEAARLLYVSITRAREACIMSYARTRMVNGIFTMRTASRFAPNLGGTFLARTTGLTAGEIQSLVNEIALL